jgi:hypothetical protein
MVQGIAPISFPRLGGAHRMYRDEPHRAEGLLSTMPREMLVAHFHVDPRLATA